MLRSLVAHLLAFVVLLSGARPVVRTFLGGVR